MKTLKVMVNKHKPWEPLEQRIHRQHVNPLARGIPGVPHQSDHDAIVDIELMVHEQATQVPMLRDDHRPDTVLVLDPHLQLLHELRNGCRSPLLMLVGLLSGKFLFGGPIGLVIRDDVRDDRSINEDAVWKMELAFVFGKKAKRKGVHFDCQSEIGQDPLDLIQ